MSNTLGKPIPSIRVSAFGGVGAQVSIPSIRLVVAEGGAHASGSIPSITIAASGLTGSVSQAEIAIPSIKIFAHGGGILSQLIPSIGISASGSINVIGKLTRAVPRISLTAHAWQEEKGNLSVSIPSIRIDATGYVNPIATLNRSIPAFRISGNGLVGMTGSLSQPIPSISIRSNSYWVGTNGSIITIPSIRISTRVTHGTAMGLALNTKNMGLTKYPTFGYNSLCVFNGNLLGANGTAVYEFSGSDDDGTVISQKIRTGKLDLQKHYLRYLWITGKVDGNLNLAVEDIDGNRYEYVGEGITVNDNEIRIKVGKGIKSRYVTFELYNNADTQLSIDKIRVFGKPGTRKR